MKVEEAIRVLEKHQKWRRYDGDVGESPKMQNPLTIGKAIDVLIIHSKEKL